MLKIFHGLVALMLLSASAHAQGLAMHGAPKYPADFDHVGYANPDAPKGGQVIQSFPGTFDSLNPFAIKGTAAQGLQLYYDRLMARAWDEPFTMYPLIAQKANVPDDRSSITFHLDPRAKFRDGSSITAADVIFSFETLRDQGRPNMRRVYKLVAKAETPDARTVKFTLGEGYDRETVMILAMMPVLSKTWWKGRTFDSALLQPPLSSGPYAIASVDPGRRIVYERDKNYWAANLPVNKGQYNFDRIVYDYYRDDTVALEAFKAGNVDLRREFNAAKWDTSYDIPAVKNGDIIKESIPHARTERLTALIFNTRRAPFDDITVREALSHMLDFRWINANLFRNQYKRAASYFPNSNLAASGVPKTAEVALLSPWKDKLPVRTFGRAWEPPDVRDQADLRNHLRQADALLKRAGWIIKDGKRVKASDPSKRLTFEMIVNQREDEKIALQFAANLERLGITMTIRVLDSAAFTGRLNDYDYDMVLHYWQNTLSPGSEQMSYWTCDAREQKSRWNYSGICNPAIDSLTKGIAQSKTREDLEARVHALDRALTWGWYMIPLYYSGVDNVAYRQFLSHPAQTPVYGFTFETWWAKGPEKPDVDIKANKR